MDKQKRLEQYFSRFPGIGPRQAKRFLYHILSQSDSYIKDFIDSIQEIKRDTTRCTMCERIFIIPHHIGTGKQKDLPCNICSSADRDKSTIMVVSRESDLENVERSGAFNGLYFVIGGIIPLMEQEYDNFIRLSKLIRRIKNDIGIREIIISLSLNREGENTKDIIKAEIQKIRNDIKISELGRGLSTGSEIEYADSATIKSALKNKI